MQKMIAALRQSGKSLLAVLVILAIFSLGNLPLPQQTAFAQSHGTSVLRVVPKAAQVWIPRTGKKYHRNKKCSNMKNPRKVSLSNAKSRGFKACKKCY